VANARFQSNGVDALIDTIVKHRETPEDARDRLWQVAWARGYQDLLTAVPVPDSRIDGHVVYMREFPSGRGLVCVDTGEQVVGFYDWIEVAPAGSRVRLTPLQGQRSEWALKAASILGCGLSIRFDEAAAPQRTVGASYVDRLRACMQAVRDGEYAVRKRLDQERSMLAFVQEPTPFRNEMEDADKALRERVLQSGYSDEEKTQVAKIKNQEAMQAFVAARNKRLVDLYRVEVVKFREQIPELRAAWDKRYEAYVEFRQAINHFNEVDNRSRAITDQVAKSVQLLDPIEAAMLNVRAEALEDVEENPRAHFGELVGTIDLLYELVPKRLQKVASAS
jgi:hypothetical protein